MSNLTEHMKLERRITVNNFELYLLERDMAALRAALRSTGIDDLSTENLERLAGVDGNTEPAEPTERR